LNVVFITENSIIARATRAQMKNKVYRFKNFKDELEV